MEEHEGMRNLYSMLHGMQSEALIEVLVRQSTTYVSHICRAATRGSGSLSTSGVCMSHAYSVCAWEELSGPDRVSLHDKQLLRSGMYAGQSGK